MSNIDNLSHRTNGGMHKAVKGRTLQEISKDIQELTRELNFIRMALDDHANSKVLVGENTIIRLDFKARKYFESALNHHAQLVKEKINELIREMAKHDNLK